MTDRRVFFERACRAASLTAFDPASDPSGRALEAALTLAVAIVDRAARS